MSVDLGTILAAAGVGGLQGLQQRQQNQQKQQFMQQKADQEALRTHIMQQQANQSGIDPQIKARDSGYMMNPDGTLGGIDPSWNSTQLNDYEPPQKSGAAGAVSPSSFSNKPVPDEETETPNPSDARAGVLPTPWLAAGALPKPKNSSDLRAAQPADPSVDPETPDPGVVDSFTQARLRAQIKAEGSASGGGSQSMTDKHIKQLKDYLAGKGPAPEGNEPVYAGFANLLNTPESKSISPLDAEALGSVAPGAAAKMSGNNIPISALGKSFKQNAPKGTYRQEYASAGRALPSELEGIADTTAPDSVAATLRGLNAQDASAANAQKNRDAAAALATQKAKASGGPATPLDKVFSKQYNDYTSGDRDAALAELAKFRSAADAFRNYKEENGLMGGLDRRNALFNPLNGKLVEAKNMAEDAASGSLKDKFGSRVSNLDLMTGLKFTVNPSMQTADIAKGLEEKADLLQKRIDARDAKAAYFESHNQHLAGFTETRNAGPSYIRDSMYNGNLQPGTAPKQGDVAASSAKLGIPMNKVNQMKQFSSGTAQKLYSASRNKTKVIHQDGSTEILDGDQR